MLKRATTGTTLVQLECTTLTSECIPRVPVLLYDRPILDNLGKPRETCPVCGRFIIETDIDVVIVLELQEFWRGMVCDENKVDLTLGVGWQFSST